MGNHRTMHAIWEQTKWRSDEFVCTSQIRIWKRPRTDSIRTVTDSNPHNGICRSYSLVRTIQQAMRYWFATLSMKKTLVMISLLQRHYAAVACIGRGCKVNVKDDGENVLRNQERKLSQCGTPWTLSPSELSSTEIDKHTINSARRT